MVTVVAVVAVAVSISTCTRPVSDELHIYNDADTTSGSRPHSTTVVAENPPRIPHPNSGGSCEAEH